MTRTSEVISAAKDTRVWLGSWRLVIAGTIFHLVVTITVYGLGRYAVLPGTFDSNGIAISFAPDGTELREEADKLSADLAHGQIRDWLVASSPFHIKLYSICFVLFGPLVGSNILSAEPLNALCYLAILVLVFNLGREIFDRRCGLIAAATVALWPSFLLHTTQLLRDPLFLIGMLALIFINSRFLSKSLSWPGALLTGAAGGLVALFIWLTRDNMGELLIGTVGLGAAILIVRQLREKHFQTANLVGIGLLIAMSVAVTRFVPKFRKPDTQRHAVVASEQNNLSLSSTGGGNQVALEASETPSNPSSRIAARVGKVRQRFVNEYPDAGSNIDTKVQLDGMSDLIRYLPRAAEIGFFAPFPNMWFATGNQISLGGRLCSGLETMAMYLIEGLAIVGLWRAGRGRSRFSVWFLALVAAMGMISLGFVVVNVGALYRLRYLFLILLIIVATSGVTQTFDWYKKK